MLKIGDKAPSFALETPSGTVKSSDFKGKRYVLYFYPADDTPGCTKEACSFRDNFVRFNAASVTVLGVSPQDVKSKQKFIDKYNLNFPLLADLDHGLADAYGAWVEKSMYGKKYMGVQRSTFVIGADGKIEQVWEKVKPEDHAAEVLAYLGGGVAQKTADGGRQTAVKTAPKAKPAAKVATAKKAAAKPAAKKKK
jgi:thioredoxin-dependent peroxiredoxin